MQRTNSLSLTTFSAIVLVALVFVRPQEFVDWLAGVPVFNITVGLTALGLVAEVALGGVRAVPLPLLVTALVSAAWSLLVTSYRLGASTGFSVWLPNVLYQLVFMIAVMVGGQSRVRLRALLVTIVVISVALCAVMVHQSDAEFQCIRLRQEQNEVDFSTGKSDGRSCESLLDCYKNPPDRKAYYQCEKAGLFNTFTTGFGRVRWRGKLSDPNEVCILVACALAFAFALHAESRARLRTVLLLLVVGLSVWTAVLSQSRGGILVMLAVFGVQFVRRYGARGLVIAVVLTSPLLLLGGRSGAEAEESANERLALLYQGMDMVKTDPLVGVGVEAFRDHVWPPLTAHNSYLLAAAELGLLGQLLFCTTLYVCLKIPFVVATAPPKVVSSGLRNYGVALSTAMAGMLVGIFFLSMNYHPLPFIVFGLSGALYGAVRAEAPHFKIGFAPKEMFGVGVFCGTFLVGMYAYTRYKGMP